MKQSLTNFPVRSLAVGALALACLMGSLGGQPLLAQADTDSGESTAQSDGDSREPYLASSRAEASAGGFMSTVNTLLASFDYVTFSASAQSAGASPASPLVAVHGQFPTTNPVTGAGLWQGRVVGIDNSSGLARGNRIIGDAEITIEDFMNPTLDLRFSRLYDIDNGSPRDDMEWSDISVSRGEFSAADDTSSLSGRFYGSNHEEVAGTFDRDLVAGAFGAARGDIGIGVAPGAGLSSGAEAAPPEEVEGLATTLLHFDFGAVFKPEGVGTSRVHTQFSGSNEAASFDGQTDLYAVWLSDSHAFDFRESLRFGTGPGTRLDRSVAYSGGLSPSAAPMSGSATWVGSMVGMDPGNPELEMRGDARISIADFTDPAAFIELTDIREVGTDKSRPNIYWNRVPVTQGSFSGRTTGGWVEGRFHGENHEEATGTFYRQSVAGTFGAYRTDVTERRTIARAVGSQVFNTVGYISGTNITPDSSESSVATSDSGSEAVSFEAAQWAYFVAATGSAGPAAAFAAQWDGQALPTLGALTQDILGSIDNLEDRTAGVRSGLLPHGVFGAVRYELADADGSTVAYTAGFAFGHAADTNPWSGSATWTGSVYGIDVSSGETAGNHIDGSVTVTIADFAMPSVSISFTGLRDMELDAPRADMAWDSIPLNSGAFRSKLETSVIDGHIFGDDHSHVGGVFERDEVVGGFGAERVLEP